MSHLLDDEDDDLRSSQDRELTLSTTAILGIFFGLVLLCGLFFAFGYNMGSHHNAPPGDGSDNTTPSSSSTPATSFNSFKPAAGSPAASSSSGTTYPAPASSAPAATTTTTRANDTTPTPAPHAPIIVVDHSQVPPTPAPAPAAGTFVVQVAAVSPTHQEDADMLVSDLHSKGYAVAAHTSPADQLIHIQVGPFSSRPAAEAMRQRLQNDGFNAIIK
ncbi:MAG: SPOR domain-containing protein [Acidobacteriota bacterium]